MLILVGASASGKTEIAKRLGAVFNIKKAVTHTSRLPRKGEINHIDYHFVTPEEFIKLKEEGAFVETTFYNGNYYGCSKKEITHKAVTLPIDEHDAKQKRGIDYTGQVYVIA